MPLFRALFRNDYSPLTVFKLDIEVLDKLKVPFAH